MRDLVELLGIYDADGGLAGEVRYVVGHLLGFAECALCDITHSPVRRKRAWDQLVADLPVEVRVVHRNEVPDWAVEAARTALPVILGRWDDGSVDVLLAPSDLQACAGSVEAFQARLERALADQGC